MIKREAVVQICVEVISRRDGQILQPHWVNRIGKLFGRNLFAMDGDDAATKIASANWTMMGSASFGRMGSGRWNLL